MHSREHFLTNHHFRTISDFSTDCSFPSIILGILGQECLTLRTKTEDLAGEGRRSTGLEYMIVTRFEYPLIIIQTDLIAVSGVSHCVMVAKRANA